MRGGRGPAGEGEGKRGNETDHVCGGEWWGHLSLRRYTQSLVSKANCLGGGGKEFRFDLLRVHDMMIPEEAYSAR